MNNNQLEVLHEEFTEIVSSMAYKALKEHFQTISLNANPYASLEDLGKAHIRESGIKYVFDTIEQFATGVLKEDGPTADEATALEPETEDDEALSLLD